MLTYQKFERTDLPLMADLTLASFGRTADADYYNWKYYQNPQGEVVGYTAKNEKGELAGFYGAIPEAYYFNGTKHLLYQSCDTMTHPSYRRMGIFETLAKKTYEELEQQQKFLVKGFAGQMSYSGFVNKLGWKGIERIKPHFKLLVQLKISNFFHRLRPKDSLIHFENSRLIKDEMNELDNTRSLSSPIFKSRDKNYLEWRFKDPAAESQMLYCYKNNMLAGYCIYAIESNSLLLIRDIFAINNSIYSEILNEISSIAVQKKMKGLYSWTNKNSIFYTLFKNKQFIQNPFNKGKMTSPLYFIILENNTVAPSSFILNSTNWNLLPIDYDF